MKKIYVLIIIAIISALFACHEFDNTFDPYYGLTAYYPLEGDGDNKADIFNNAKIIGGELITGHLNDVDSAYDLTDDDSYIDCGYVGMLSESEPELTISVWFKRSSTSGALDNYNNLFGKDNYYLDFENNAPRFELELQDSYSELSVPASNNYGDNQWHHLVATGEVFEENGDTYTRIRLYIDNVYIGEDSEEDLPDTSSTIHLVFGNIKVDSDLEWPGSVDNIRVYNRLLTTAEISGLYNETE